MNSRPFFDRFIFGRLAEFKWDRPAALFLSPDRGEPRRPAEPTIRTFDELLAMARSAGRSPLSSRGPFPPTRYRTDKASAEDRIRARNMMRRYFRSLKRDRKRALAA